MKEICYLELMLRKRRHVVFGLFLCFLSLNLVKGQETSQQVLQQKKPYSVSVGLRQGYDDNIYTSSNNQKGSMTTGIQPSFLINYPLDQTLLSGRYTFDSLYYWDREGDGWDLSHELVGRINHSVSERFNLDLRERFRYAQNPEILDSASALQRNGNYINNTASLQGSFQWTPKFGTVTTYTNDLYDYEDEITKQTNNNMSQTVNQDLRFLIDPTVTIVTGGIFQDVSYEYADRSFNVYTGNVGADWTVSPQVTVSGRVGGQYFDPGDGGSGSTSPYGSLGLNWILGARSSLSANYSHSLSQTDIATSYAQETDTITSTFKYQWTPRFSTSLQGLYTFGSYTTEMEIPNSGMGDYEENVATLTLGATYKLNEWLDLDASYTFTNVADDTNRDREYTRNQISLGIRGTY
ncbi:MAG: hypothetical protein B9S32_08450 [Verrucomicrobia bacterium Tous-C9LFEB]|nr:MAG: hypothetical protein B9S32_08450 [Verrucomicrobia bacterium Tous-C9LFEB]